MADKYNFLASFLILQHTDDVTGNPVSFTPTQEQCRDTIKKIIKSKKEGRRVMFSTKTYEKVLDWPDYKIDKIMNKKPDFPAPKCQAGSYFCNIDTDGKVYPCVMTIGEVDAIRWQDGGFQKAWEHINEHGCKACFSPCYTEFHYLFSLNPRVIYNTIKYMTYEKGLI